VLDDVVAKLGSGPHARYLNSSFFMPTSATTIDRPTQLESPSSVIRKTRLDALIPPLPQHQRASPLLPACFRAGLVYRMWRENERGRCKRFLLLPVRLMLRLSSLTCILSFRDRCARKADGRSRGKQQRKAGFG